MKKREAFVFSQYTCREEIAHSLIHGFGVLFGVGSLTALLMLACLYGTPVHFTSYLIYGTSLILLYTCSTLYHALPQLTAKRIFKICDHAAIYLLIAGSYTPFLAINMPRNFGVAFLITVWSMALLGVIFKLFFTGRAKPISVLLYLSMGWMLIGAIEPLKESLSSKALIWIFAGGLTYTIGVIFYLWKKIPYHHAIWHFFVLAGSVFHFIAILYASNLSI
jgi:hemolysin III